MLSLTYKQWHDAMEATGENHPPYTSAHQYYLDVVMNLLHCQGGLCAYTEVLLCGEADCEPGRWADGRYPVAVRPEARGHLEHFDRALKDTKGWLWSNLFVVDSDVN